VQLEFNAKARRRKVNAQKWDLKIFAPARLGGLALKVVRIVQAWEKAAIWK
jgi:hypothetical protein